MTRSLVLLASLLAVGLLCSQASAQKSTGPVYKHYNWPGCNNCYAGYQVDQGTQTSGSPGTTSLLTETGLDVAPPGGLLQVPIPSTSLLVGPKTIHEVHGNVAFVVWSPSSCAVGSIIAQVLNQDGDSIASVFLEGLTTNSSDNVPIKGTFPSGLAVSALTLQTFSSQCGPVTLSWSLVMS